MERDIDVLVNWPEDEDSEAQPVEAVLRISEGGLTLWHFYRHGGRGSWLPRRFQPFRGPWLVQALLTSFWAPTFLAGRRDFRWLGRDQGKSCLRIAPLFPPEFWMDVHFESQEDAEAVAATMHGFWATRANGGAFRPGRFLRDWWRAAGLLLFLAIMITMPAASSQQSALVGLLAFAVYVGIVMTVEVVGGRRHQPPRSTRSEVDHT